MYLKDLLFTIKNTIDSEKNSIDLITNVKVDNLNINQVIPLGLLLNELMTNSLKYAFKGRKKGKINVDITPSDNSIKVVYEDNGNGYPDDVIFGGGGGFDHTLIHTLLEQLSEDYNVETKGKFRLEFEFEKSTKGAQSTF